MSLFLPRRPRPFRHEYRYARPKRLISGDADREERQPSSGRMSLLLIGIILLALLLLYQYLSNG